MIKILLLSFKASILKGPTGSKSHLYFWLRAKEFGYYILFGACQKEITVKLLLNILSGTQLTVKQ